MQDSTPPMDPRPTDFRAGRDGPLLTLSGIAKPSWGRWLPRALGIGCAAAGRTADSDAVKS